MKLGALVQLASRHASRAINPPAQSEPAIPRAQALVVSDRINGNGRFWMRNSLRHHFPLGTWAAGSRPSREDKHGKYRRHTSLRRARISPPRRCRGWPPSGSVPRSPRDSSRRHFSELHQFSRRRPLLGVRNCLRYLPWYTIQCTKRHGLSSAPVWGNSSAAIGPPFDFDGGHVQRLSSVYERFIWLESPASAAASFGALCRIDLAANAVTRGCNGMAHDLLCLLHRRAAREEQHSGHW
jgi:hypothetical protein